MLFVAGGMDGDTKILDVETGEELGTFALTDGRFGTSPGPDTEYSVIQVPAAG